MKPNLLTIAIVLSFCIVAFMAGFISGKSEGAKLPTIKRMQIRIGANPDGKLGPETQAKWESAEDATFDRWEYLKRLAEYERQGDKI